MKKPIETKNAPGAVGPFSQGILTDNLIFVSGQIACDPKTGIFAETIEEQTKQSLENVKAVLEAAGSSMDKVVKTTVLMTDLKDFSKMNAVYATYFEKDAPARACFEVVALPKDSKIEIEAIALR